MEFRELAAARRSVRKYRPDPIPRAVLEELLETACWAPSGDNLQPWYFVVLTNREDIDRLRQAVEQMAEGLRPHLEELFPAHPHVVAETVRFLHSLGDAPVYVLAFLQEKEYLHRDSMVESTAAAIENLVLAAQEKGVGTCWINAATATGCGETLRQLFAPDKGEFLSLITMGYPASAPRAPARKPGRWVIR